MATLLDLYDIRRSIAQNRQGTHKDFYEELHAFLISLKKDQSYDLDFGTKLKFRALKLFVNGTFGRQAHVPVRDKFIYRICNMVDLVKGTSWRKKKASDAANWDHIYKKCKGDWTRLSKFAEGTYKCCPRRFSWWTSFPLFQDVVSGAHRVGMTNDWVPKQCVVLRCPVDYVNQNKLAFVPSVIDAFMHMIFHPTKDDACPPHGLTIDLSLYPTTLCPGTDEVVLPPISVKQLEILPVNADDAYRKGKHTVVAEDNEMLSELLEYYYRNMGGAK
jgi:hypothetical protein